MRLNGGSAKSPLVLWGAVVAVLASYGATIVQQWFHRPVDGRYHAATGPRSLGSVDIKGGIR